MTAKEMFRKLGYSYTEYNLAEVGAADLTTQDEPLIIYEKKLHGYPYRIEFHLNGEYVTAGVQLTLADKILDVPAPLTANGIAAIHVQMTELGWL